jgi:hypothetical protein
MDGALPRNEDEIDTFVAAFESGTLPKARWTHAAHLLTGACYVHSYGESDAIDRMRRKVSAYNVAVGGQNTETGGYHETITVFWIKVLAKFLREHPVMTRAEFARLAVGEFAEQRDYFRRYYEFDVVKSTEARRVWVAPGLQRLD